MIGIDEVGRGCWAGPLLVVAARQKGALPERLKDSKKLSKKTRENVYEQILALCEYGEGWVSAREIDELGLSAAMRVGVKRALEAIRAANDEDIIMDGLVNYCDEIFEQVRCIARADDLFPVVSAASVYAKVTRDQYMYSLKERYALYEFDRHVGYGTKLHAELILKHGVTDQHRLSFAPLQKYVSSE